MPNQSDVLSQRTFVCDGVTVSVSNFYSLIEQLVAPYTFPGLKMTRVFQREGGLVGAKREYLRIKCGRQAFDIGASVFGESFTVSWRLQRLKIHWLRWIAGFVLVCSFLDLVSVRLYHAVTSFLGCLLVPVVFAMVLYFMARRVPGVEFLVNAAQDLFGLAWKRLRFPTFFQLDTSAAFQSVVPAIVERTVETLRSGQGLRTSTGDISSALSAT